MKSTRQGSAGLINNAKLKRYLVPALVLFSLVGATLIIRSLAATGRSISFEPEIGARSGNIGEGDDGNASGSKFALLNAVAAPTPTPTLTIAPTATPIPGSGPVGPAGSFTQTFSDEFDTYDSGTWTRTYPWDESGNERRAADGGTYQIIDPANVTASAGTLKLQFKKLPQPETLDGMTRDWTTGMMHTRNKVTFDGDAGGTYIEIRSKQAKGNGFWSHVWLLPEDFARDPTCDVQRYTLKMHSFNGKYPDVSEYNVRGRTGCTGGAESLSDDSFLHTGIDHSADFHVYGMDWYPDHIDFYFDGQKVYTSDDIAGNSGPGFLILNGYVTADGLNGRTYYPYDSAPDATTPSEAAFEVDYVRAWKRQ
jgi:hypothetical protein